MPTVDFAFNIMGETIPADHGYALYSAICRVVSTIHSDERMGIHHIRGLLVGNRLLALTPDSRLTFRLPPESCRSVMALAGKTLDIDGHLVQVGVPHAIALRPSPELQSRLVVIKGAIQPESFIEALKRKLTALGVNGAPVLIKRASQRSFEGKSTQNIAQSPYIRRTIRIRDKQIVGYAVRLMKMTANDSIKVQENGLGGRRRFGCGIFVPAPEE